MVLSNRVFVSGPAGIGKTVFAKHWATRFKSKQPVKHEDQHQSYFYMPAGLGKQPLEEAFADYHGEGCVIWRNTPHDIDRRSSWAETRYPQIDEQIFTNTTFPAQLELHPQDVYVNFSQLSEYPRQIKMTIKLVAALSNKILTYTGIIDTTAKADADTFGETTVNTVRYCMEAHHHSLIAPTI